MIIISFYINKCSVQHESIHTNIIRFFMDWWYSSDQDWGGKKASFLWRLQSGWWDIIRNHQVVRNIYCQSSVGENEAGCRTTVHWQSALRAGLSRDGRWVLQMKKKEPCKQTPKERRGPISLSYPVSGKKTEKVWLRNVISDKSRNKQNTGHIREKAMAPHSSTVACKIPWMEEPGGLQSMGSLRVGHDWATSLSLFTFMHWRRKWQPTPVFLPGESHGRRSLVGCSPWGCTESDTTEAT